MLTPVSIDGSVLPVPPPSSLDPVSNETPIDAPPPAYTVRRGLQHVIRHRAHHPYHHLSIEELAWARRLSRGDARSPVRSSGASDGVPTCHPSSLVDGTADEQPRVARPGIGWCDVGPRVSGVVGDHGDPSGSSGSTCGRSGAEESNRDQVPGFVPFGGSGDVRFGQQPSRGRTRGFEEADVRAARRVRERQGGVFGADS